MNQEVETKEEHKKQTRKELMYEILRFLLVGGIATIADYAAFFLFREVILPKNNVGLFFATAIGFVVGLVVNYILSIIFVFKNGREKQSVKNFVIFTVIGVLGLLITEAGMMFGTIIYFKIDGSFHCMPEIIMKCIMTGIVLVWNYIGRKIFIFKN